MRDSRRFSIALGRAAVKLRLAALALCIVQLAGCAFSFYKPDAASGKVVKAWCPPVHSVILFEVDDVVIGFELSPVQKDRVLARITFEIPEHRSVQLVDRSVQISHSTSGGSKGELIGRVWVSSGRSSAISLGKPMGGRTEERLFGQTTRYGKTKHAYYFLSAEVAVEQSDQLFLKPPRFLVNETSVDLPRVTFSKTEGHAFVGLNC